MEEHLYNLYFFFTGQFTRDYQPGIVQRFAEHGEHLQSARESDAPLILVLSHVLKSFSENLQDWWKALREACKKNTVLVLVLESTEVSKFIPHLLLGDQKPTIGKFPPDSSSGSFGGAFVWNAKIPMPLMHSPTAKIHPSRDLDSMQSMPAVPTPAHAAVPTSQSVLGGLCAGHVHKSSESQHPVAATGPYCPDCQSPMVIRTNRKGFNPGSKFWGCTQYPRCKGPTRPA